ncbi:RagB/SusD family nutrient uptake outer membrane protein [Halosquirtibacter laminarini]|uniref:RagB/SusD family nutrient uptake outer membrane protein n=1 Tax=Halosquirtibacter laminarini TaxID=3374600 RepID=A0AC61NEE5_9BACT|nr:RagB/SusD family nutrient uptake outer membrane protein [Prolixibacteraceae bacterium]
MKNIISKYTLVTSAIVLFLLTSCDDFLDKKPLDQVTPQVYLNEESQLASYAITQYSFPTHGGWGIGTFGYDNNTDNQATSNSNKIYKPGQYRVGNVDSWTFSKIRKLNYFIEDVIPKWKEDKIRGNKTNIEHYIGEVYFLRAYEYFNKLQALGDFPIIRKVLKDQKEELIEASKRQPRNLVARFIISDLDSAIMLMKNNPSGGKNRLTKSAAQLFKSRVALFEGTWLKYHKGTAHVPGGQGWTGAGLSYLSDFTIDIDSEIDYFLKESKSAAKEVINEYSLTNNNHQLNAPEIWDNPYYDMFSAEDLTIFNEVIFWRSFNITENVYHHTNHYLQDSGGNSGYTKGFVESFLMSNGLPIYASGSGYSGDTTVKLVKKNRDERLQLFMKAKGEIITEADTAKAPNIISIAERRSVTGYDIKKGVSRYKNQSQNSTLGSIVFRATEAYLNYIEASYLLSGGIDATASKCWRDLRNRAGVNPDFNITIASTDMSKESKGDWGAYSKGALIDATLYNIRRERRCELMAEGSRMRDLKRWRALDQVHNYQIEGFNLWGGAILKDYEDDKGNSTLIPEGTSDSPNVSNQSNSNYLRPYQIIKKNNLVYDGYNWNKAHYLEPIAFSHFQLSSHGTPSESVIYQNPYWPIAANGTPID